MLFPEISDHGDVKIQRFCEYRENVAFVLHTSRFGWSTCNLGKGKHCRFESGQKR